ncbi:alpha/beta hydrolase [Nocardioides bizhenqiangii]|uniref:Alpha/beta hydrolase n=1 Tax=Nocardioides bizhenqiangii TaxID=3095076 RepID=A0ABZ0ZR89_9ACTN|nr:alpha/beta hydrolase [Nocardioides sp. HM61]WQQ26845.1 alpha/beta hydrolase [Nocardioides sp. HM61]
MKKWIVAIIVIWALVIAAGVTVGVVLVTGDDDEDAGDESSPGSESTSETAPGTSPPADIGTVPPGLESFYGQQVAWEACGANQCGTLEVPLDYAEPDGESIEIALEMAPATGERIGSMVVNPGGPGAPGTDVAAQADAYFAPALLERYDIVGFDPRGTGDSSPVDCVTDSELDAYVAGDPDPDNRREVRDFVETQESFWAGCEEKSGDLGSHVSTIEVARDMDVLRAVLGEEKLPYFGFSYGTRLGATYAELFPDNVGRFVLDGAVDPSLPTLEGSLSQAEGFETALRAYLENCVDDGDCFLGDTVDESLQTIDDLLAEIESEPLPTDEDRDLAIGNAFYGIVLPLYSETNWPLLDQGLQEALDGKGDTLLFLSDFYGSREGGEYVDNSLEAISVINCLDDPWSISAEEVPDYYDEFEEASPTFGRVFAWGLVGCHDTPFQTTEPEIEIDGSGADPIVVIGTTRDPATPYEEAVAMAEQLESAVLLSRDGDGHTAYNKGNACIDDAVHSYFIDGAVPADGKEC